MPQRKPRPRSSIETDGIVFAVHHDRKAGCDDNADWVNRFTGSRDMIATVWTLP